VIIPWSCVNQCNDVAWFEAGVTGVMAASHFAEGRYLMYFGAYAFAGEFVPLCGEYTCCNGCIMAHNFY